MCKYLLVTAGIASISTLHIMSYWRGAVTSAPVRFHAPTYVDTVIPQRYLGLAITQLRCTNSSTHVICRGHVAHIWTRCLSITCHVEVCVFTRVRCHLSYWLHLDPCWGIPLSLVQVCHVDYIMRWNRYDVLPFIRCLHTLVQCHVTVARISLVSCCIHSYAWAWVATYPFHITLSCYDVVQRVHSLHCQIMST